MTNNEDDQLMTGQGNMNELEGYDYTDDEVKASDYSSSSMSRLLNNKLILFEGFVFVIT